MGCRAHAPSRHAPPPPPTIGAARYFSASVQPPQTVEAARLEVDFNRGNAGPHTADKIRELWPATVWLHTAPGLCELRQSKDSPTNLHLRATYPANTFGPFNQACQWRLKSHIPYSRGYLSYKVRFSPDFDFRRGGKLPGLVGGRANTGGERPTGMDGFSARVMWRENGAVVQYVYHQDQEAQFGDDYPWNKGHPRHFTKGVWHSIEVVVEANTPGKYDGSMRAWMDGDLALEHEGIRLRATDEYGVDGFYFSTFFGGNDPSWAPTKDEYIEFDDFVILLR